MPTFEELKYILFILLGIWVVVIVRRSGTRTIYQSNGERSATNYMVKHIQDNNGKVMRHAKETSGQTWEVRTPDGEITHYTTINTEDIEDDNL